jgi:hypothetical protein
MRHQIFITNLYKIIIKRDIKALETPFQTITLMTLIDLGIESELKLKELKIINQI